MKVKKLKLLFLLLMLASSKLLLAQTPPPPPPPPSEFPVNDNIFVLVGIAIIFGIYKLKDFIKPKKIT